jgi:malonyl-CoA O-methyltransferase|tara:strand:+ start:62209 stop:63009 length:801 start_codon:yes stop_codon:yes gene_type:complete
MQIDKLQVARQFSRAAVHYQSVSHVQNKMASELLQRLPENLDKPSSVLDLGCGSGFLTAKLADRFNGAQVIGLDIAGGMLQASKSYFPQVLVGIAKEPVLIQGDMESLPIASASFELVVSNAALQWTNYGSSITEVERILVPGGIAVLATFIEGTLAEWRRALQSIGLNLAHEMHDQEFLAKIARQAGFEVITSESEEQRLPHSNLADLVRSTKRMGATNALKERSRGLMGRGTYASLMNAIQKEFPDREYYSNYRSGYLVLRKPK